jgi:hypothetical protein
MDILKAKSPDFKEKMLERAFDPNRPAYNSMYKKALRYLSSEPKLEPVLDLAFKLSPIFIISVTGANPPLQFVANVPLLNENQNYRQLLYWGRFPAFFYSAAALFFLLLFLKNLNLKKDNYNLMAVFSWLFMIFSWQHIIYAKQVYQYSLNALVALLFVLNYVQVLKGKTNLLFAVIFPVLLYYCSYQVLWLFPAFYLLLIYFAYQAKDWNGIKKLMVYGAVTAVLILPSLIYNLLHFVGYSTKYYQIGPNGEFLFQIGSINGFFQKIFYTVRFFLVNSLLTYRANIVPYPVETLPGQILSFIYFFLFLTGIYRANKANNELVKKTGWFITFSFVVLFISNLTGQMPLTPCRLSIFYLAYFVFFTAYGSVYYIQKIKPKYQKGSTLIIVLLISIIFSLGYPIVMKDRLDPIKENTIEQLIDKYKVKTIVAYNLSQNIHLMPKLIKKVNYYEDDYPRPSKLQGYWDYKTIMYFSTRTPYGKTEFNYLKQRINADKTIREKWHYNYNDYKVLYNFEYDTDVQVEYTKDNPNPTNDLYLTVITLQ